MRKLSLLTPSVFLFCFAVHAQDSLNTTTLREVVVSASRTEQPVIDIPRSVTVITGEVLRKGVYQSLGDLLNAQSGLYVVGAQQTPGANQNIFMRGANSNQVAVLIDGVRITDPSSPNAAIDLSEISLADIERVEVIRGSHSTMFGGAAIGGVINLITRKEGAAGFQGNASWQGGTFGEEAWLSAETVDLSHSFNNGVYIRGSLFREDVNGMNATLIPEDIPSFTADHDDFKKTDVSFGGGFRNESWNGSISYRKSHQYTEVDNGAFSDDDNYYLLFDRDHLRYNVALNMKPAWRFSLLGSVSDSERFYENDSSRISATTWDKAYSSGSYFGKLQTHEAQLNFHKERIDGVFGIGLYNEKMLFENYFFFNDSTFPFESRTNYDTLDTRTTTRYLLAQAKYEPGKFRLSGGARWSYHTLAGNFLTFELNPSFALGDFLLYGSLSTAFNPPSLYQLFDPSKGFSADIARGNPDLEPERSVSFEGGIKKAFPSGSFLTLSVYHTKVDRSIEYVYLWNGSKPLSEITFADDRGDTYINVGKQRVSGVELDGYAQITDGLFFKGNISFLHTGISVDPEDTDPARMGGHHIQLYNLGTFLNQRVEQKKMVRRPNITAFGRLSYRPVESITVSTSYRYTGERFDAGYDGSLGPYGALARLGVSAYHLVDVGFLWEATKHLSIAANVENVLDENYREVIGFRTRGRGLYVKVIAKW